MNKYISPQTAVLLAVFLHILREPIQVIEITTKTFYYQLHYSPGAQLISRRFSVMSCTVRDGGDALIGKIRGEIPKVFLWNFPSEVGPPRAKKTGRFRNMNKELAKFSMISAATVLGFTNNKPGTGNRYIKIQGFIINN